MLIGESVRECVEIVHEENGEVNQLRRVNEGKMDAISKFVFISRIR